MKIEKIKHYWHGIIWRFSTLFMLPIGIFFLLLAHLIIPIEWILTGSDNRYRNALEKFWCKWVDRIRNNT